MIYKPDNVKLVVTHNGVEQEIMGFDESAYYGECSEVSGEQVECVFHRVSKTKEVSKSKPKSKPKSSRCKDTIDWVEEEYGDEYKKAKKGEVGY